MIRIFSFAASCAGSSSHTAKMSDILAEAFRKKAETLGEEVSYECMTGADIHVDYCQSCVNCFDHGFCPLDEGDDMPMLKQKMLDCDILFFGSPVYLWNVSGIAKSVLDRISYWMHRCELLGKPCAVFTTTSSNHGAKVSKDLETVLSFSGAVMVNAGFSDNNGIRIDPDETAQRLLEVYRSPASGISALQQDAFLHRVIIARKALKNAGDGQLPDEVRVLYERGITKYVLLSEAIEALCQKKD